VNRSEGNGVKRLVWIIARREGIKPSRAATYRSLKKNPTNQINTCTQTKKLYQTWAQTHYFIGIQNVL